MNSASGIARGSLLLPSRSVCTHGGANPKTLTRAIPLAEFIEETMRVLETDADEVLVERAKQLRNSAGPHEAAVVTQFNDAF